MGSDRPMRRPTMRPNLISFLAVALCAAAATAPAQTPNSATLVVVVVDQTGAVLPAAEVSVTNTATGSHRAATSGSDGSATMAALPLTGTYDVTVTRQGFDEGRVAGIVLRAGET